MPRHSVLSRDRKPRSVCTISPSVSRGFFSFLFLTKPSSFLPSTPILSGVRDFRWAHDGEQMFLLRSLMGSAHSPP